MVVRATAGEEEAEHDQFTERGDYGQPAWAERNRASATTRAYVLSPFELFVGNLWQVGRGHGRTGHELVQEIDFGLPHRFELGLENEVALDSSVRASRLGVEARYAFADWHKLPLNPAVSVEYFTQLGRRAVFHRADREGNALAARLLLAHEFTHDLAYACNLGLQQELNRSRGTEVEFDQAITRGLCDGKLEIGAEMQAIHSFRHHSANELSFAPTVGWKPTRQLHVTFAPTLGYTGHRPRFISSLLVSYEFGGAEVVLPAGH